MKLGKLSLDILESLLKSVPLRDPRVILGPSPGEDAAIIDFGNRVMVAKTDPITFANDMIGWYSVQINANDVACCGAKPRWFMATLLVPPDFHECQIKAIFQQIVEACESLDISLIGGHTEITKSLNNPIISGSMLGEAEKSSYVTTSGAREGDSILITKGIAIEGTALLARDAEKFLLRRGISQTVIGSSKELLFKPGISVVKECLAVCSTGAVHSLHDPTEGGLTTGLYEIAYAANSGLAIEMDNIPVIHETQIICTALGLDPMGLLASGSLIITLPSEDVPRIIDLLHSINVAAHEIGHVTHKDDGVVMSTQHGMQPLPRFERDELARFFEETT